MKDRLRSAFLFCAAGLAWALLSVPSRAQELEHRPNDAPQLSEAQSQAENPDPSGPTFDRETGGSNDRLFWALPNFLTLENAHNVPPLTSEQKFKLVVRQTLDPAQFPFFGFLAGISQADNSESGYGQGATGYARRFGSNFADGTSESFFVQAIFPSLFRQDPRYYQDGKGTLWRRAGYAVSRIAVTRKDTGRMAFNISEVAGSGMAAAISNTYHPPSDRKLPNTIETWAAMMSWDAVTNMLKEFWPDIRRKVHQRKG